MVDGTSTMTSSELTADGKRMMLVLVGLKCGAAEQDNKVLDISLKAARKGTGYEYGTGNGDSSESLDMTPAQRKKQGRFDGGQVNEIGAFFVTGCDALAASISEASLRETAPVSACRRRRSHRWPRASSLSLKRWRTTRHSRN
jgi:hypothetical protein